MRAAFRSSPASSRFALQALPPEDFPDLASGDLANTFSLPAADLKGLIEKTRFAISTEETRYYLNGIYLHEVAAGALLRAVATDGHRLAQAQIALPKGAKGMPGIIVPRKTVLELVKLIEGEDGDVEIALSASKIRFTVGNLVLTSKLIDGTFPDYERVIPRNNDKVLDVDTKTFADAVDRVSTISIEKGRAVKLNIAVGQADAHRQQSGFRLGRRGNAGGIRPRPHRYRLQRPLSSRCGKPDEDRPHQFPARRCGLAHHRQGPRRRSGPLCSDAHAGVNLFAL